MARPVAQLVAERHRSARRLYVPFNLSRHNRLMDLSFNRRNSPQAIGLRLAPDLASLLAKIAARQALSPTAQAQLRAETPAYTRPASFNPDVAKLILTQWQPS